MLESDKNSIVIKFLNSLHVFKRKIRLLLGRWRLDACQNTWLCISKLSLNSINIVINLLSADLLSLINFPHDTTQFYNQTPIF